MGRNALPPNKRRNTKISFRLDDRELQKLIEMKRRKKKSMGAVIRGLIR